MLCRTHHRFKVHRIPAVIRVPYDVNQRIFKNLHQCLRILLLCTGADTWNMKACNNDVHFFKQCVRHIQCSVIVHNIGFTAKQTAHAEFFPRQDLKVAEIQFAAAARHFRRMLRKRNSRQPDLCCLSCHFIYCVISVSACNRMCMCIN